jgi:hypothetical protein
MISTKTISIVIGSWGSYNECNERALGSKWLDLDDYSDWEEIEAELVKQGFELDGIDEELFIQDIEGMPSSAADWDYTSPQHLFNLIKESGILKNDYYFEVMEAFLEVRCMSDFEELVNKHGEEWILYVHMYKGFDWYDYGKQFFDDCGYKLPDSLEDFIDFEAYGKYIGEYVEEYSNGLIEIENY